ncbi:lytic polysaccharide monooxygenase [Glycomyces buryatensis]|uniref:Cellulose-binding protein n=1 Tax=Glycomyces buryatensis TaxID=2570927 RepID=A0A4S8QDL2_9ACTN|nr:lytic polysaccharide monooxygenase [Glycomyces buryatensis]THV42643.1 cellulose-binding protein [Glycomyces buryatensis]
MLRTRKLRRSLIVIVAAMFAAVSGLVFIQTASGHGTATTPPARQYSCWERWGDDHLNPDMAQEDPMCWQAWQANPNTMWNWNGLLREGLNDQHETAIPDGQLCSGGHAEGGRYNSLDEVGPWHTTPLENDFTLHYEDTARHGSDYYWVYVTKQGFDPTTEALGWGDLERVVTTGTYEPGEAVDIPVSAPGRTGAHIVYVVWQASHLDQAFYSCSDVWFGEGGPTEEPTDPTESPTDEPTDDPTSDGPTTGEPADLACEASATVSSWGSGATVQVTVAATGARTVNSWMLHWAWADGSNVAISNIWGAEHSQMGGLEMAEPVSYNQKINASDTVTFGFNVSGSLTSMPEMDCLPA